MKSHTTRRFREAYRALPQDVRRRARAAFHLWLQDPHHPSLRFKEIRKHKSVYSVRIGVDWRALGVVRGDAVIWFWIGSHADYDQVVAAL